MISGLAIWIMEEEREFGEGSLIRNQRRRKSQVARAEFGAEVSSRSWAVGPRAQMEDGALGLGLAGRRAGGDT